MSEEDVPWQKVFAEKNPQLALFQVVEEFLSQDIKPFLVDMSFQQGVLWIQVAHPCAVQLLFMKRKAIMCELRVLSTSLLVKDVRFMSSSIVPKSGTIGEKQESSFVFAPTGEVEGDVVEIENERLKELMEALSRSIRMREESKRR